MFVYCAHTAEYIDTISSAYDSPMSLPDRVQIWFTPVEPFLPKFCPQPCWFERQRHSITNCGQMVRDKATVTMYSL